MFTTHISSEHHLYGSSRVGLQKYLPDQLQYSYALGQTSGNSFNTLMAPKPWYSRYAHDLFTPAATRDSSVTKTNLEISGMGIMSHVLGNRHYELNNHLGNVQATVLDRVTPIIKPIDTSLIGYKADISTTQDYYPFGMLMPGRYVADTAAKCVTINTTILVPHKVRVYPRPVSLIPQRYDGPNSIPVDQLAKAQSFENEEIFLFHYNDADTHPGGVVATSYLSAEGEVEHAITLDGEPSGGVISYLQLHMDTTQLEQEVGFTLELPPGVRAEVRVRQYYNTGEEYYPAIDWTMIETNGPQQLYVPVDKTAIGAGGNTLLEMQFMDNAMEDFDPGATVFARNYYTYISHYEPQARIVTICDEKDNYRFGFNGHEKDNEVKGIGNHYNFEGHGLDARLGRRLNVDPQAVRFPTQSPYSTFNNSPIFFEDPTGESGQASIDKQSRTITISSTIVLYGTKASLATAKDVASKTQQMWNAANGKVTIDGVKYDVKFNIKGEYRDVNKQIGYTGVPKVAAEILTNSDIKKNFFRLEKTDKASQVANPVNGSFFMGSNSGFINSDQNNRTGGTTIPHEYGHGLGLGHYKNVGDDNRIMYTERQLGKNAKNRQVTQGDIDDLNLDKLEFDKNGKADVGEKTNAYYEQDLKGPTQVITK